MVAHHPDPFGRNRGIEGQVAGFVTRIEVGLLGGDAVDGQETSGITAHHVISGKSHDTLDIVALVEMDGQPRGYRTHYPAHRGTLARAKSPSRIGEGVSAVEDDKVPPLQRCCLLYTSDAADDLLCV